MDSFSDNSSKEYARLTQQISSQIQQISKNVTSIQRMVGQIGTSQDTDQFRQKLHEIQHHTHTMSQTTMESLKSLANLPQPADNAEQRQMKIQRERLTNDFSVVLNNFQTAQRSAVAKEKASVMKARADSANADDDGAATLAAGPFPAPRLQLEQQVDIQMIQEREQALRQLESDILDVNQIFKDLALMVHEQGEMIDSIEANVDSAVVHVDQGSSNVQRAAQYQSKVRRKRLFCLIFLIILIIVIALIIYFSVKSNK